MLSTPFLFLESKLLKIKSSFFKLIFLISFIVIFTGCSALGGGSIAKRSIKLSNGIQNAYAVESNTANRVAPIIIQAAEKYDLNPLMLAAMIQQESSYRNYVISPAGAIGLTQIMPNYWEQICPGDLFEETTNINCGSFILAKYNQSAGSWKKALAYYNVGPTGYKSSWKMKRQGKKYARQIKQHEEKLKKVL